MVRCYAHYVCLLTYMFKYTDAQLTREIAPTQTDITLDAKAPTTDLNKTSSSEPSKDTEVHTTTIPLSPLPPHLPTTKTTNTTTIQSPTNQHAANKKSLQIVTTNLDELDIFIQNNQLNYNTSTANNNTSTNNNKNSTNTNNSTVDPNKPLNATHKPNIHTNTTNTHTTTTHTTFPATTTTSSKSIPINSMPKPQNSNRPSSTALNPKSASVLPKPPKEYGEISSSDDDNDDGRDDDDVLVGTGSNIGGNNKGDLKMSGSGDNNNKTNYNYSREEAMKSDRRKNNRGCAHRKSYRLEVYIHV